MKKYLKDLHRRKDLILSLVTSGLKAQHRNSFLGYFWWLLDPLLGVLIYYFVVVIVFRRGDENYGVYLVIGMVIWRWLSATVNSASRSIIAQGGIITQVYLPKVIFPLSASLTQLIHFVFGLVIVALFLLGFRMVPGQEVLSLPLLIMMQLIFQMALALLVAYVSVFVRDIDTLIGHCLRLWFFGSPVIWRQDMIPASARWILDVNPMAYFLDGYRDVLMYHSVPDFGVLSVITLFSACVIGLTTYFYYQYEHRIIKAL